MFGDDRPLWFEIGFGKGEHLATQAEANPQVGLVGCEPFLNGVVGALNEIEARGLTNVRLHMGDALDVLERLPDASLSRVFLLHPDPWPKARHAKRRFVNPGPLDVISAKLKPGGELRVGGKCLDIADRSNSNGARLIAWPCNGGSNQRWYPSGSQIRSHFNGKCLDVGSPRPRPETQVVVWDCNRGAGQRWWW